MTSSGAAGLRLFLLGFLTLFLELALIRYLAGNIWNLGYFPNLVLIAVFVGMAIGFTFHHALSEQASRRLFPAAAALLLVLAALVTFAHPRVPGFGSFHADLGGELYFTGPREVNSRAPLNRDRSAIASTGPREVNSRAPLDRDRSAIASTGPREVNPRAAQDGGGLGNALLFAVWFVMAVATFAAIAQRTARVFRAFAPLTAYTLDIAGSCCGILAFGAMSAWTLPPHVWFGVAALLFVLAADPGGRGLAWLAAACLAGAAALSAHQDTRLLAAASVRIPVSVVWSPYQKVEYVDTPAVPHRIFVNGIAHQSMQPAAELREERGEIPYARPYRERSRRPELPPYRRVLVLGAGSGNDVAAALLHGAEHVDAVEIDPVIAELGRRRHPARPYDDPRVRLVVDDGRAFLTRAGGPYDLVVFALTDSLVKVSPMAQLRLENYLFTEQAVARARRLLSPDGDLVFYNFYRQPWLRAKIEAMVARATGHAPARLLERGDFAMIAAGRHNRGAAPAAAFEVPTDDWPFLYLERRRIPAVYRVALAGLGALLLALMYALHRQARRSAHLPQGGLAIKAGFVLMGIAFLLLETKSVIQFSLLFGTTWVNSSLVFLAVLLLVLAANAAARRLPASGLAWIYLLLLGSSLLTLAFPLARLLEVDSVAWRFMAAALLTFSPIFFANLIFSLVFRDQPAAEHLFGWNLIGATLGGVVEYASLAVGYNNLAILVAVCYTAAFGLLLRRSPAAGGEAASAPAQPAARPGGEAAGEGADVGGRGVGQG